VAAVGEDSDDEPPSRATLALADRLGTWAVPFPGDHGGFGMNTEEFAAKLNEVLEVSRSRLRLNMMMSLDGFVAAPEQGPEKPFGIGGMQLTEWLLPLRAFRELHGEEGGEVNASTPFVRDGSRTSALR
jgi:hypothetical protein